MTTNAISVKDLRVTYGRRKKVEILKGINLEVPQGKIYGLLGPSGCGKTTLLKSIIGRLRYTSGDVKVFGHKPGTKESGVPGRLVGYMPQGYGLYMNMTIRQTLEYYGGVYLMSPEDIEERINFLTKFLDLPTSNQIIRSLSGGQKRRVSLAVCLIHKPSILVLDEPTVGVDPLLCQMIWKYLVKMSKEEGVTVIITTHYIEETKQADFVGMMRKGKMLAQGNPQHLMNHYGYTNLEDLFVKLCMDDRYPNEGGPSNATVIEQSSQPANNTSVPVAWASPVKEERFADVVKKHRRIFVAQSRKNMLRLLQTWESAFIAILVPPAILAITLAAIGRDAYDIPIAIVKYDNDSVSHSSVFQNNLNNYTIRQIQIQNKSDVLDHLDGRQFSGLIEIGKNFSSSILNRFKKPFSLDNDTIINSAINVYLDKWNVMVNYFIVRDLLEGFKNFVTDIFGSEKNPILLNPIKMHKPIYGTEKPTFTEFIAPALLICLPFLIAMVLTAFSIMTEKIEETLDRTLTAGVPAWQLLVSELFAQGIVLAGCSAVSLFIVIVVFSIECKGSFIVAYLIIVGQGFTGMAIGLVTSCLADLPLEVALLGNMLSVVPIIFCGAIWPTEAMPRFFQVLSKFHFQTYSIDALRSVFFRGWGLQRLSIWAAFGMDALWGSLMYSLAIISFYFQ